MIGFADRTLLCGVAFSGWDDVGGVGAVDANKSVPGSAFNTFCTNCCIFTVSWSSRTCGTVTTIEDIISVCGLVSPSSASCEHRAVVEL